MKKIFLKLTLLIIIFALFISIPAFANTNTFRVSFQSGKNVNAGESIEIPIILDNINFDGIQKGLISFNCDFNYDSSIFEIIPYSDNSYIKISDEMVDYISLHHNTQNNKFIFQLNTTYFTDIGDYINSYIQIGTINLKATESAASGYYDLSITNIEGGNDEMIITVPDSTSQLFITGMENKQTQEEESPLLGTTTNLNTNNKELIYDIKQNTDGSKIIITVDIINGIELGVINFNDTDLTSDNGIYEVDATPGIMNTIKLFDKSGNLVGITSFQSVSPEEVSTSLDSNNTNNGDNNIQDNQNITNKPSGSVQTGDKIIIAVSTILIIISIGLIIWIFKKINKI